MFFIAWRLRKKIVFAVVALAALSSPWVIYESQYVNRVAFVSPIDFEGGVPIRNDSRGKGEFGASRNGKRLHNGLDILAPIGAPVKAMRSGRVINAEYHRGLGDYVEILHSDGLISIYAHLSKVYVRQKERVRQGQIIGEVGKSGNASHRSILPHLHFEIRKDNVPVNPRDVIPSYRCVVVPSGS